MKKYIFIQIGELAIINGGICDYSMFLFCFELFCFVFHFIWKRKCLNFAEQLRIKWHSAKHLTGPETPLLSFHDKNCVYSSSVSAAFWKSSRRKVLHEELTALLPVDLLIVLLLLQKLWIFCPLIPICLCGLLSNFQITAAGGRSVMQEPRGDWKNESKARTSAYKLVNSTIS